MGKILKGTVLYGRLESVLNVAWSQIEKKKTASLKGPLPSHCCELKHWIPLRYILHLRSYIEHS